VAEPDPVQLDDGGATEGPLWHRAGHLTFTRLRVSELVRWDPAGPTVEVIRRGTGTANGCTLDAQERIVCCQAETRSLTRIEPDGSVTTLADSYRGARLNRPNDVVRRRADDALYFTDPHTRMPVADREIGHPALWRLAAGGALTLATDACEYPNGLAFSPDESLLYVAITLRDEGCIGEDERGELCRHRLIRVFDVAADGSLSNNRVFADLTDDVPGRPDGVKVDTEGRVYCASSRGIWVFEPSGRHLGVIPVPGKARNLAFGGEDFRTLFITAGDCLFRLPMRVPGIGAFDDAG
jgi:gluconolactonase